MKQFEIPEFYRSPLISKVKAKRRAEDMRKKDFSPTLLDFGTVKFLIARHFGFCYGVENAIEIAYKALEENPDKRIFLLSQMIHNPEVNADLQSRGIRFILDTKGGQIIPWEEIHSDDIVLIPAFGTTLEIESLMKSKGIKTETYNTTCPFVEKVWNRSSKLGEDDFAIIIHGKPNHEETRATFSHSTNASPSLVIKDMAEAKLISSLIEGVRPMKDFKSLFEGRFSKNFIPEEHLFKVGVVNQTTMLAEETKAIANQIKSSILKVKGEANYKTHFADTRDTLCYATNDNQTSTKALLESSADLAIVVGGYNSSNTTHLVELLEEKYATYFINSDKSILDHNTIEHYDIHSSAIKTTDTFLVAEPTIILTSGASCPDSVVERVLNKILSFFPDAKDVDTVAREYNVS